LKRKSATEDQINPTKTPPMTSLNQWTFRYILSKQTMSINRRERLPTNILRGFDRREAPLKMMCKIIIVKGIIDDA